MKSFLSALRSRPLLACAALSAALCPTFASGQSGADETALTLDDFVVSAARTPQDRAHVASSVTVIRPGELPDKQITSLGEALRAVPGVSVLQTGGTGGVTSLLVRGSKSAQTLFLVDGVRFNDTNTSYASWLGGFSPAAFDRIEVLRGPQSTLYGGAAMGGVISVGLARGAGEPAGEVAVEAGSFQTVRGTVAAQGEAGAFAYALSASVLETDNDRADNETQLANYAVRIDYRASATTAVGGTFRYLDSHYKDPNDIRTFNTTPISNNDLTGSLATLFAELTPVEAWSARLTAGVQKQRYDNDGSFSGFPSPYFTDTTREMLDWQNTVRVTETITAVAGASHERSKFADGGIYPDDKLKSVYAQAEWQATGDLRVGAGLRYDDYSSFGEVVTGRVTASQRLTGTGARLHATVGTSFLPPSLSQRYGSAFTVASPGLQPEKSTGWDAGIEQTLAKDKLAVDVTYFSNRYKNLIAYQGAVFPALGNYRNLGRAETAGVETTLRATPTEQIAATVSWTYLDVTDATSGARLDDRPRHTFAADVTWQPLAAWLVGAGVHGASDRRATDFNAFPSVQLNPGDYAVARLYASWRVSDRLVVRARIENLLNRHYEETYGFPSAGAAAYTGVEFKF